MKPIELEAIDLTQQYLTRFWQRDYMFAVIPFVAAPLHA